MRRILFYCFLFTLATWMTACEDSLTLLPPNGQVKAEYWKKKEDVKAILMGAYQQLANLDSRLFYYGELRADMLVADNDLSNPLRYIMECNIYPDNAYSNWRYFYSAINYCNSVLRYSPEVKALDGTFGPFDFAAYNAEAVFLRSLTYFYLVRIFRDVPYIEEPYDTDDQDFFPPKTEGSVILDSLENQLNRVRSSIPEDYDTNDKTRGRATRGAVDALLADIALWQFDYESCIRYVERIEQSGLYDLNPGGKWYSIFSEGNTVEGIFELQFDSQLGQNNHMYDITRSSDDKKFFLTSTYTMQILSPDLSKEVVRGYGTVTDDGIIWKYIGQNPDGISLRSVSTGGSCNWIVYRLADLLLMKAEALSQLGRYDESLFIINEIRGRAFMELIGSYPQSPQEFEDLILKERAKELAFEGKRWFDLLRMGRRNDYERKARLIEIIIENVPATQKRVLASKLSDPYGWYLPIYDIEIEYNANLVQNPYYQSYGD